MNKSIIRLSLFLVVLVGCNTKTPEKSASEGTISTDLIVNPEATVEIDLLVEGMTCTGCENTINNGVSEITGVIEVKSSFQEGTTFVKYDSTQTNIEKISEIISDQGYMVKGYTFRKAEENNSSPKD